MNLIDVVYLRNKYFQAIAIVYIYQDVWTNEQINKIKWL